MLSQITRMYNIILSKKAYIKSSDGNIMNYRTKTAATKSISLGMSMRASVRRKPTYRYYKRRSSWALWVILHITPSSKPLLDFPLDQQIGQTKRFAFISGPDLMYEEANKLSAIKFCQSDIIE